MILRVNILNLFKQELCPEVLSRRWKYFDTKLQRRIQSAFARTLKRSDVTKFHDTLDCDL